MNDLNLHNFIYLFFYLISGIIVLLIPLAVSYLLRPEFRSNIESPLNSNIKKQKKMINTEFTASYFIIFMIFTSTFSSLFFIFPLISIFKKAYGSYVIFMIFLFLVIIFSAFIYAWFKGIFKWKMN